MASNKLHAQTYFIHYPLEIYILQTTEFGNHTETPCHYRTAVAPYEFQHIALLIFVHWSKH